MDELCFLIGNILVRTIVDLLAISCKRIAWNTFSGLHENLFPSKFDNRKKGSEHSGMIDKAINGGNET